MAPRKRWWHVLQASKNEARLAVDLYNRSGTERQLEAFIIHMTMGWLKLLQAHAERGDHDVFVRDQRGHRVRHKDGGWTYKSLDQLLKEMFSDKDPRLVNIRFFLGLRNRIEHRHERNIAAIVAGRTQAYLLNYEGTLTEFFGREEAMGDELRFPLFLSSLTEDATAALKKVRDQVPKGVLEWIQDFDATLDPETTTDLRYDFRVYLIPHTGSKGDADAAMTFIRSDDLTPEQNAVMDQVRTIIREKQVPVENLGTRLPGQVVEAVAPQLARSFTLHHHTQAWKYFKVRPSTGSASPSSTKGDFCRYNDAFGQYVFTDAWVNYLVRKLSDPVTYQAVLDYRDSP